MKKLLVLSFVSIISVSVFASDEPVQKADGAQSLTKTTAKAPVGDDNESLLDSWTPGERDKVESGLAAPAAPAAPNVLVTLAKNLGFSLSGSTGVPEEEDLFEFKGLQNKGYADYLKGGLSTVSAGIKSLASSASPSYLFSRKTEAVHTLPLQAEGGLWSVSSGLVSLASYASPSYLFSRKTEAVHTLPLQAEGSYTSQDEGAPIPQVDPKQAVKDFAYKLGILHTEVDEIFKMAADNPNKEDVPIDIFFINPKFIYYLGIIAKFNARNLAGSLGNLMSTLNITKFVGLITRLTQPALTVIGNNVSQKDKNNLPKILLRDALKIAQNAETRDAFWKLPLSKRSIEFETKEYGKGYVVIVDRHHGKRRVALNAEPMALAAVQDQKALDALVASPGAITLDAWSGARFVPECSIEMMLLEWTLNKDAFGNTCGIYECLAYPETFMIDFIRVHKDKWDQYMELYDMVWQLSHSETQS